MDKVFETERLLVRRHTMADEEDFFILNSDIDIVRFIRPPKSRLESLEDMQAERPGMRWMQDRSNIWRVRRDSQSIGKPHALRLRG